MGALQIPHSGCQQPIRIGGMNAASWADAQTVMAWQYSDCHSAANACLQALSVLSSDDGQPDESCGLQRSMPGQAVQFMICTDILQAAVIQTIVSDRAGGLTRGGQAGTHGDVKAGVARKGGPQLWGSADCTTILEQGLPVDSKPPPHIFWHRLEGCCQLFQLYLSPIDSQPVSKSTTLMPV